MLSLRPHTPALFLWFGTLLALCAVSTAWGGLPAFRIGYWNDEPIFFGLLCASAAIGSWLICGIACGWLSCYKPRGNPLYYAWLAWIGWQALVTLCAQSPWRSWFGPPEQSEGMAWYLCASLIMLMLAVLWERPRLRLLVLSYMLATSLLLAIMHLVSDAANNTFSGFFFPPIPEDYFAHWLPFIWPDYLAYMAAWGWIALLLTYRNLRLRWLLPIAFGMSIVILASSNHFAFFLLSYALLITLTVRIIAALKLPHFSKVSTTWRQLANLALLLPLFWLLASPLIYTEYRGTVSQSLPSRILFNQISINALADQPQRLLIGEGWGRFADDFFRYGLIRDIRIYDDGKHRPNWSLSRGYNYHSHNMASETLLSLGIIGFLIWLCTPMLAIRRLPEGDFWNVMPMLVAVTYLQHAWFYMPQNLMFQALCWMLLIRAARPVSELAPPAAASQHRMSAIIAGMTIALLWSIHGQWEAMRYARWLNDPLGEQYGNVLTREQLEEDIPRGGDRLRSFFITYTKKIAPNQERLQPKHAALYGLYVEAAEQLAQAPHTGAYNGAAILYGYNMLISTMQHPLFQPLREQALSHYFTYALLHAKRAPYREDSIAPFLLSAWRDAEKSSPDRLMEAIAQLLSLHPAHRSALWLGGKTLFAQAESRAQGLEMMRTALSLHADRIFPIPEEEIKWLYSQ